MRRNQFSILLLVGALCSNVISCGGSSTSDDDTTTPTPTNPNIITEETLARFDVTELESAIQDEPKITAQMTVTNYVVGEEPIVEYQGYIGIEYRGSSSLSMFPKKGYGIETRDETGEGIDVSLLGMPEEEDWALHGPYSDKSLMRNTLMFDIGAAFDRYSSRWQYVDLYIEEEYLGVYVLLEKVKRDENRVNINKLKDDENSGEDVTGGYILKLDKTTGEHESDPSAWDKFTPDMSFQSEYGSVVTSGTHYFIYHTPKSEDITEPQKTYIQDYVHQFEDALISQNFQDETLGYRNFIDASSFVDYFLATEISGNIDGYRLSTYVYKDKNAKLSMGPLWDYNLAFGNADYCGAYQTDIWVYEKDFRCTEHKFSVPFWWYRLLEDQSFRDEVKVRWQTLRKTVLSNDTLLANIEEKSEYLLNTGAVSNNFKRWDTIGDYIWPNYYVGDTYSQEVKYLKTWLTERLAWLDEQIDAF